MTNEDLKIMQAWPLERKIRVSQSHIMKWYQHWGGRVYISFSGGKDSTVLLDLARRVYPDIEAVFCDTGLEYPEVRKFALSHSNVTKIRPEKTFHEVLTEKGYPIGSKKIARMLRTCQNPTDRNKVTVRLYRTGIKRDGTRSKNFKLAKRWLKFIDSDYRASEECCDYMKKAPLKRFGKETGKKPIIGTMAEDSSFRKINWLKTGCNAFSADDPQCKPLSFWTEQDILRYLKITGIPYCSVYGEIREQQQETMQFLQKNLYTTGCDHTGCMFCMFGVHLENEPNRFQRMRITHPKQYDYCINKLGCGAVLDYIGVPY
ncbi:Phosphoadenosine phosphosulfate reductase family protein [Eubacterium callanderi]|uniref:Phosphoadenosine phosphosulfate reductase family protein n=1 Tax=Eubacterium callanderi TaxID=53442 RepID=A0AB74EWF0_9FIRM|nr:phosphoadenosine phosphosulfate reductase family protein [Eubacterium callanderi]MDY7110902.1 Phosphoadenosine phosphosulfate reductase [Eubacterium callanderi]SHK94128.1 Phosphoadenosine phosphosulfate reductase family protein [Eubacterium callanderi]